LARRRADLITDLGGAADLSTQRAAIVDLVVREKLMLDSVDAYLLELGSGISNRKKRALASVVRERAALADAMTRRLQASRPGPPRQGGADVRQLPRREVHRDRPACAGKREKRGSPAVEGDERPAGEAAEGEEQ